MKRMCLWLIALLASASSIAQAQSISVDQTNYRNYTSLSVNGGREYRFFLIPAGARSRLGLRPVGFSSMPAGGGSTSTTLGRLRLAAGPNLQVLGSGTIGRLPKWTGVTSTNSFIGDSMIFESKLGLVGIGTDLPTSKLTVAGTIESTAGGFKFPDGSIQTTAGIAPNQVVRSLNGLMGDVTLVGSGVITVTPSGNTLTIAAPNALSSVVHDSTLIGNGTTGSPLGVAVPLILSASVGTGGVIEATNTADGQQGIVAVGGFSEGNFGGNGVLAVGGDSKTFVGGPGVRALGGGSTNDFGGDGVIARGGDSTSLAGGAGVRAFGGSSDLGGPGVVAAGGDGNGNGQSGGDGIRAFRGLGFNGAASGLAGRFEGDVEITGNLSKGGGSFKIDHPLDPENKYLYHSFVESPEMMNIYNGNVTTDGNGEATVTLPSYFEALNRDFRYQLTVIGTFAHAIVAEKIKGGSFKIRTSTPGVEVSWQVTGIRRDGWANRNRIPVEEDKPEVERGYYLYPEAFDQPDEKSVNWARYPEMMKQRKQQRVEVEQSRKRTQR